MQCKKCGTEIKEGCLFCHNCGEAVQMVPDYEPVLDDLQIRLAKAQTKMPNRQTVEKLEEKTGEGIQTLKKLNWKLVGTVLLIFFGIMSFVISYGSVLKKQEPGAMQEQEDVTETENTTVRVSMPEYSIPGGQYSHYVSIEITSDISGAIYYTLDGSIPDEYSYRYVTPIKLLEGTTIVRSFVMDGDGNSSEVASEVYELEFGAPDAPTIIPESGEYAGEIYVRILVPEGCMAYYTLDGSEPTTGSELYTGEFLMPTGTTVVQAMVEDETGELSEVSSVLYTCTETVQ